MYSQEELSFEVRGEPRKALLRTPERLSPFPTLLINLVGAQASSFEPDYRTVPDIFLAAGHRVASFDLPCHGERPNPFGRQLVGWAEAIAAGVDIFADIRETGRALMDLAVARKYARAGQFLLNGTSRGGLAALHIMAGDERVLACAILAPLTHLPHPKEFRHLAENDLARRSCASALVERLADRHVFITIGTTDPRVGEQHCFDFFAQLSARSRICPPELFCAPGQSHGTTYPDALGYQAAAAFLLRCYADEAKMSSVAQA